MADPLKRMFMKPSMLLAVIFMVGTPSLGLGQQSDHYQIFAQAIHHMRAQLGADMVLDKSVQQTLDADPAIGAALPALLEETRVRVVDSRERRQCTDIGNAYYAGPESFVFFAQPRVLADSATLRVTWSKTGRSGAHLVMNSWTAVLNFQKISGRWTFMRESPHEYFHAVDRHCD